MEMATLQFYQNKFRYPKFTQSLTVYGSPLQCTPVGVNLRSGTLRVKGTFADFMNCNYLSLYREGGLIYAWIDDVRFRTEDSFEIQYSVDAWRTYKGKVSLGTQFIKRSPAATFLKDNLLGSTQPYMDIKSESNVIGSASQRVAVVQIRASAGEVFSNTPVQPNPYQFYLVEYPVNRWQDCVPLSTLMSTLAANAETQNVVTIYSVPWFDITSFAENPLVIQKVGGNALEPISGFKCIDASSSMASKLYNEKAITINNANELMKSDHSIQIVIPEAGIIHIPDEILGKGEIKLRQDIDIFSGACNYMITTGSNANGNYNIYGNSVRGSSISSIPIISDPMDTYLSQNQNALATSLIGDVASLAMGAAMMASPAAAGLGGAAAALGGSMSASSGVNGLMNTAAQLGDAGNNYANPPAFLGQALAANFSGVFWLVTRSRKVTNAAQVNSTFGYPYNMVDTLTFPAAGFIQTESCMVESTDGSVPRWALEEINAMFNNGVLVK
jgi:hypothetical protein